MAAGPSVLSVLLRAHYRIEPQGPDGLSRCLSCPQCCLDNGVSPIGDPRMQFSAQHAAAASGRLDVLEWLEARLPPQPSARQMLFRADDAAAEAGAPAAPPASTRVSADTGGWPSDPPQAEGVVEGSCDIYTVSGEAVMRSPRAFFDRFVRGTLPVVVRGLVRADKALSPAVDALSRRFLLERLGRTVWEVGDIPYEGRYTASAPEPMTLETYVEQVIDGCNATAPCPRYVFAERFERDGRVVAVKSERLMAMPTWAKVSKVRAAKGTQFFLGSKHSGAPMHYHQSAYNVLVYGRKRWVLTPPSDSSFSTVPAHDWLTRTLPLLRSANRSLYECVQHAGDVLVLPDLWGHLTYNLDVSVGLAQEFEYFA